MLRPGDLLVLNDSRVIPARLFAHRAGLHTQTGHHVTGRVQVLLAEQLSEWEWRALVRPGRKVLTGEVLEFGNGELRAEVIAHGEFGERTLRFEPVTDFFGVVERLGHMPLPPYIHREDRRRGSRALPDRLRAGARIGGCADGRAAFYPGDPRGDSGARRGDCRA